MSQGPVDAEDVRVALAARHELGEEMEPHVIDAFLARVESRIDERLVAREPAQRNRGHDDRALALTIVSLAAAIPLTAIGVTQAGLVGLLVVWVGIVLVNFAYSQRR